MGYHFVDASKVIGDVHTFSIAEGFANRAEVGYTRSVHIEGDSALFSSLWHFPGMNIFNGKVVALKDGQFGPWTPGVGAGFVVRTNDRFVTGALDQEITGTLKSYTNGDRVCGGDQDVVASAVAVPGEPGVEGDQRFDLRAWRAGYAVWRTAVRRPRYSAASLPHGDCAGGRVYAGATDVEEPGRDPLPAGWRAHLPTTLDYAMRVTQKDNPHFAFDIGVGQVANTIGTTVLQTPDGPVLIRWTYLAKHVVGMGLSLRY